jgi:hypothetical protein
LDPDAFSGMDEEYYNWADSGMDHAQFLSIRRVATSRF